MGGMGQRRRVGGRKMAVSYEMKKRLDVGGWGICKGGSGWNVEEALDHRCENVE